MLNAPLLWALGERADIVVPMRFAMIPLCVVTLWCVYRIGLALYGRRAALWSTLATALVPVYFFTSCEFRTDDLWLVFWVATLLALLAGNSPAWFWSGVFMGCAFASSMKTSLLAGCLIAAGIFVALFRFIDRARSSKKEEPEPQKFKTALGLLWAVLGMLIVPGLIVGFFWSKGALKEFYYCVVQHNVVPGMGNSKLGLHSLRLPIAMPFLLAIGFGLYRYASRPEIGVRRALVFLTGGIYLMALRSYWPLITAQDYLPFVPLLCLVVTPLFLSLLDLRFRQAPPAALPLNAPPLSTPLFLVILDRTNFPILQVGAPLLACGVLLGMAIHEHPFWENDTRKQLEMMRDVLALTDPADPLMDGKGETIFRKRPFYYVLEGITIERIRLGLTPNTIVHDLVEAKTPVVHISRLQGDAPAFVRANYLPVNSLHVLGKFLTQANQPAGASYSFSVAVPAQYDLVTPSGPLRAHSTPSSPASPDAAPALEITLDGLPFDGPRQLQPGTHELRLNAPHAPIALFWAKAVQRGYSPFQ
jgi:hypothetical protein